MEDGSGMVMVRSAQFITDHSYSMEDGSGKVMVRSAQFISDYS